MTYGFYLNNLQKVRLFRQLNQDQLANKLNVSLSTYRDIETLKRKAKCQLITKLEEILNMPRNEIIGNKIEKKGGEKNNEKWTLGI